MNEEDTLWFCSEGHVRCPCHRPARFRGQIIWDTEVRRRDLSDAAMIDVVARHISRITGMVSRPSRQRTEQSPSTRTGSILTGEWSRVRARMLSPSGEQYTLEWTPMGFLGDEDRSDG